MTRTMRTLSLSLLLALVTLACNSGAASAHPMGNFTINQYVRLTAARDTLRLRYVLDMAELPTITERQDMDKDGDGEETAAEQNAYFADRTARWLGNLSATVDGKPVAWAKGLAKLTLVSGVANLATMRVEVSASAPLAPGRHEIRVDNRNYAERAGWKEIVIDADAPNGPTLSGADAFTDRSQALHRYPEALLANPPQEMAATFQVTVPARVRPPARPAKAQRTASPAPAHKPVPDPVVLHPAAVKPAAAPIPTAPTLAAVPAPAAAAPPVAVPAKMEAPKQGAPKPAPVRPNPPVPSGPAKTLPAIPTVSAPPAANPAAPRWEGPATTPATLAPPPGQAPSTPTSRRFQNLVTAKKITPGLLALSLLIAFFLGALHALQPGHGKTLVAAYLVGQRGTARHAVLLGITVTISHTFGVFLLGGVALYASRYILPQDLVPWMGFASGALIVALGLGMFIGRLRAGASAEGEDHHGHTHAHPHDPGVSGVPHAHHHTHNHGHDHTHSHDHGHDHSHSHSHDHDHSHSLEMPNEPAHAHPRDHGDQHTHSHEVTHAHGPFGAHTHAVPETISLRSLLALGVSGGIVPCWDALIVLLGAVAIHRTLLGIFLIVAFSAGLAATLTAAGLAVVWGQRWIGGDRLTPGRVRAISLASSLVVAVLGAGIAWQSLASAGLIGGAR